jgi:transposase-like protein
MARRRGGIKPAIRYSEAFKRQVVHELESAELTFAEARRKYGIGGGVTVQCWVRKYGNGTRGRIIRVETPEQIDQLQQLKRRVRELETALADANIDLTLERQYTRIACERAGIKDVAAFKKKTAGQRRTGG